MKLIKIMLLKLMKSQTREEGDHTVTFKVLFGKIYIQDQHVTQREFTLNKRLMNEYMSKISA